MYKHMRQPSQAAPLEKAISRNLYTCGNIVIVDSIHKMGKYTIEHKAIIVQQSQSYLWCINKMVKLAMRIHTM